MYAIIDLETSGGKFNKEKIIEIAIVIFDGKKIRKKFSTLVNPDVKVVGLMGMATFSNNETIIEKEFNALQKIYDKYKNLHKFNILSMGMSGDYKIAIKNGANMVRLGSVIFGSRS